MVLKITAHEKTEFNTERLERIKIAMQSRVDNKQIMGLSTMIAAQGELVQFEQFGFMDFAATRKMSKDAIFRIYSMTKPIICMAFMMLYEQGLFRLFDPVAKFIPGFSKPKVLTIDERGNKKELDAARPMLISDLLKHTSGLTYDFLEDFPVCELYRKAGILGNSKRSLSECIAELTRFPLAFHPGSQWHYSVSIDVIAHLIELISNQPVNQFLQEKIFNPLGMVDTSYCLPENKLSRLVPMYGRHDIAAPNITISQLIKAFETSPTHPLDVSDTHPTSDPNFMRGGHGLFSTMQDYMRFAQLQLNGGELDGVQLLSRKVIDFMYMDHLPANLKPIVMGGIPLAGYGFGLGSRVLINVADSQLPGSLGEFGWGGAAKTYYWIDPVEKIIGLFMRQDMMDFNFPEKDFQTLVYQALR